VPPEDNPLKIRAALDPPALRKWRYDDALDAERPQRPRHPLGHGVFASL
jgi:hypothetical protein